MKKIISILALAMCAAVVPLSAESAKKDKKKSENQSGLQFLENPMAQSSKFVIDGHVAFDIPDSCYNIYITDIDKAITEQDLVARVPVKDKKFRFETDLSTMKAGRIRAIMPGDQLCEAWINVYFIPGFTMDMTVHNGYYDIHNKSEYQFLTTAWLNRDAIQAISGDGKVTVPNTQQSKMEALGVALNSYQQLLHILENQIYDLSNNSYVSMRDRQEQLKKLYERMDGINAKMEALIDQYASENLK